MDDFNAQKAKQIVNSTYKEELRNILVDIKLEAEKGGSVLHVYKPIRVATLVALQDKGFVVIRSARVSMQKDGLYHSIYWE